MLTMSIAEDFSFQIRRTYTALAIRMRNWVFKHLNQRYSTPDLTISGVVKSIQYPTHSLPRLVKFLLKHKEQLYNGFPLIA